MSTVAELVQEQERLQTYVASRLAAFKDHPDWTLGQIERECFGSPDETEEP
jgi:hypothetical protein